MKYAFITLFILSITALPTLANTTPSLETFGKLEQFNNVKISPSGNLVAFRQTESDEKDYLVVYSLKDKKKISILNVSKLDPKNHYFINDEELVIIASQHLDLRDYKHAFDASTAFTLNIKTNKIEALIKLGEDVIRGGFVTRGQTGLGYVAGSSVDGDILYIPAFISDDKYDQNPSYMLLGVDSSGKGRPRVVSKGAPNTRNFFIDNNGNVLARENLNEKTNVHSIDILHEKRWKTLYSYTSKITTHDFIGLNNDFTNLIFSRNDSQNLYFQLDLEKGTTKPLENFEMKKNSGRLVKNHHGVVIGIMYSGLSPDYQLFDHALNERIQKIQAHFSEHSVYLNDWTPDWKHIIVRVEGSLHAGNYFLIRENDTPVRIINSRPDISEVDISPIGVTKYKARDGLSIPTLLTIPRPALSQLQNLPAIIMPHGGPESHDQIGYDFMAQAFASRGFLVVQPQFRGSTGFGREHLEAGFGQWGKKMQDDLSDAVLTFTKKGFIDPKRVCIVGASYGGYAALAGVAFTPELYQCAVSIAGVSHLPKMLAADKSRYGKHSEVLDYFNRSILNGDYNKSTLKSLSPYYSADKIQAPVLLIHGTDDTVVEYAQSKVMQRAIKKANGQVKMVKLKDDDHYLQDAVTRITTVKEMVNFVEKHIGTVQQ